MRPSDTHVTRRRGVFLCGFSAANHGRSGDIEEGPGAAPAGGRVGKQPQCCRVAGEARCSLAPALEGLDVRSKIVVNPNTFDFSCHNGSFLPKVELNASSFTFLSTFPFSLHLLFLGPKVMVTPVGLPYRRPHNVSPSAPPSRLHRAV